MSDLGTILEESDPLSRPEAGGESAGSRRAADLLAPAPLNVTPPSEPPDPIALIKQANVDRLRGDYAAAVAGYTAALSHQPNSAAAHLARGLTYWLWRQSDEAIADFTVALQIEPV